MQWRKFDENESIADIRESKFQIASPAFAVADFTFDRASQNPPTLHPQVHEPGGARLIGEGVAQLSHYFTSGE